MSDRDYPFGTAAMALSAKLSEIHAKLAELTATSLRNVSAITDAEIPSELLTLLEDMDYAQRRLADLAARAAWLRKQLEDPKKP